VLVPSTFVECHGQLVTAVLIVLNRPFYTTLSRQNANRGPYVILTGLNHKHGVVNTMIYLGMGIALQV
jgi:hypothetical protein